MRIKNWNKFQHYKHRNPLWIKLYRDLLNDRQWLELEGDAAQLLMNCWLLASERDGGELPPAEDIAYRLRMDVKHVQKLIPQLNHWLEQDASNVLAGCYQDASNALATCTPETETERERETDSCEVEPEKEDFERFWAEYPKRHGANPKTPAFKKWLSAVRDGVSAEIILSAARAYKAESKDKIGTPYIAHAVTWLNQRRWEDYRPQDAPPPINGAKADELLERYQQKRLREGWN